MSCFSCIRELMLYLLMVKVIVLNVLIGVRCMIILMMLKMICEKFLIILKMSWFLLFKWCSVKLNNIVNSKICRMLLLVNVLIMLFGMIFIRKVIMFCFLVCVV